MKIQDFNTSNPKFEDLASLDEAEALVTTYPNCSKAWVLYMVYYLKQAEVIKARSVGHRGLQSINFRDEEGKLNLWKALINLENHYGTKDSLDKLLKDALMYNDQEKIYSHIIDAYLSVNKDDEIENLEKVCLKKLRHKKEFWIKFATYYMQCGKHKQGREIFKRSLQSLPDKEHSDILGKKAYLEYKYGDIGQSFEAYEDIVDNYPKRKDLITIYIRVLREVGRHERAEELSTR